MDFNELLSLYFERSNALQTYWNVQITVGLGLLAFFASLKRVSHPYRFWCLFSLIYAAIATSNLLALIDVTRTRLAVWASINARVLADQDASLRTSLNKSLTTPSVGTVIAVHLLGDAVVLTGLWFLLKHPKAT